MSDTLTEKIIGAAIEVHLSRRHQTNLSVSSVAQFTITTFRRGSPAGAQRAPGAGRKRPRFSGFSPKQADDDTVIIIAFRVLMLYNTHCTKAQFRLGPVDPVTMYISKLGIGGSGR
jgi:hypothetical protein